MPEKLFTLLMFGLIGLGIEVVFTAYGHMHRPKERDIVHLFGHSSLWYLPLYAIVLPLGIYFLQAPMGDLPWFVRGLIYAFLIQIGEFLSMSLLHFLNGESPSEKHFLASGHSIKGFTRWDFFPAFFVLSLIFEYLVRNWLM